MKSHRHPVVVAFFFIVNLYFYIKYKILNNLQLTPVQKVFHPTYLRQQVKEFHLSHQMHLIYTYIYTASMDVRASTTIMLTLGIYLSPLFFLVKEKWYSVKGLFFRHWHEHKT